MTALTLDYMPTWTGVGLCIGQPELMYPDSPAALRAARATCRACPVLAECRDWVLSIPDYLGPDGVVAAMTASERERTILSRLPPKQCNTCQQVKPQYQFGINTAGRAARRAICRSCANQPPAKTDAQPGEPLKTCPRCNTPRGVSRFYPNRKNPDGLAVWCKPCFQSLKGNQ